jgi:hypothetical protein
MKTILFSDMKREDPTRKQDFDGPAPELFKIVDLTREDLETLRLALIGSAGNLSSWSNCGCGYCRAAQKFISIINSRIGPL